MGDIRDGVHMAAQIPVRRIVCAAVKFNGHIVCGPRHFDHIMWATILHMKGFEDFIKFRDDNQAPRGVLVFTQGEQGFIDQYGTFVNREDAWDIAIARGQIVRNLPDCAGKLYSEHLY